MVAEVGTLEVEQWDEVTLVRLRAAGQRLVLHVATASIVSRALDISGASRTLPCSPSLDDALRAAGGGA